MTALFADMKIDRKAKFSLAPAPTAFRVEFSAN
jgi:hypothetical protein